MIDIEYGMAMPVKPVYNIPGTLLLLLLLVIGGARLLLLLLLVIIALSGLNTKQIQG